MEQISIEISRSGEPAALIGQIRIHSSFNPGKEAARFLDTYLKDIKPKTPVVIIGAGLGYLDRELEKVRPESTIIAIHLSEKLYQARVISRSDSHNVKRWYPGNGQDIETFLFEALNETSIGGLKILEWPASIRTMPVTAERAAKALSALIRRYSGNISATAAFGKKWIRNSMRNYIELQQVVVPERISDPVVLTASGPSLENTITTLQELKGRFQLWALPSSLPVLLRAGLEPHLIITTDPGFWARFHVRYFPENIPVAMPLSAAHGLNPAPPVLLLSQGIPSEKELIGNGKWPYLKIPAVGTVAATAIEIWKRISTGPLVITGLDLCWYDLRSHARPHSFDGWLTMQSQRYNPMNNILWDRAEKSAPESSGLLRSGPALKTYADWFRQNAPFGNIYRLTPSDTETSAIPIPGIPDCGPGLLNDLSIMPVSRSFPSAPAPEDSIQRNTNIRNLICDWKKQLYSKNKLRPDIRDLLYILDPGGVLELEQSRQVDYLDIMHRHLERGRNFVNRLESIYG